MLTRLLSCLQKIRTVAGAVQRHFALLAAALWTDSAVHGRAKPLFFSLFADRATQVQFLGFDYFTKNEVPPPRHLVCYVCDWETPASSANALG